MNITKTLHTTTRLLLLAGLLTTIACNDMKGMNWSKNKTASGDKAGGESTDKASKEVVHFQGFNIIVIIDGKKTTTAQKDGSEQIWTVPPCSSTPTLTFTMDENILGPLNVASLLLNPIRNGQPVVQNIWQYAGSDKIEPGKKVTLNLFTHIAEKKMQQNIGELPAGKYRLSVQVNGEKTWDRQYIDIEVK